MTDQSLKTYRQRWEAIEQQERLELKASTIDMRWKQVNAIWGLAKALGIEVPSDERGEEIIRKRWAKLRAKSGIP